MDADLSAATLLRLMTWLSPSYPVGAFSYSHGLEFTVEQGTVHDAPSLTRWLIDLLELGSGRNDAILFRHAFEAADSPASLLRIADLAAAFTPSSERHLETTAQGRAFAQVTQDVWSCSALDLLLGDGDRPLAYPIVVAVCAAGHGLPLEPSLQAYLHGFTSNLVSAGIRLIPLGQRDGQRVIAALERPIVETVDVAQSAALEDLGGSTVMADLAAMQHETQYTRLFRS